ncbi:hypothetical protein AX16_009563 [Volvariella volvacea WC 439]|nr:hypothetical protein AX16_009563 [Volvariella volvacea WC 439]
MLGLPLRTAARRVRIPVSSLRLRSLSTLASSCPACGARLSTTLPACNNCWYISSLPPSTTLHQIFNLPEEPNPFRVDIPTLKQRFREAQAVCHPDSWTSKGANKQDVAQSLSSGINDAYQRLLKPLSRAEYILERNEFPITEHDQLTDMEFILEIMQQREAIEEAGERDMVYEVAKENDAKIQETIGEIERLMEEQKWGEAKEVVIRLRYLEGIGRAAEAALESLGVA